MATVISERSILLCNDCRLYSANGDLPAHLEGSALDAWAERWALAGQTLDICDQWSEGYDEFSASACDGCGTTSGGERYSATATIFADQWAGKDYEFARLAASGNWPRETCTARLCVRGGCCKSTWHHAGDCCLHCGNDERGPGGVALPRVDAAPDMSTVGACLSWLAEMDRNGLWGEYVEDFAAASAEHGPLDVEGLRDVIAEMLA